MTRFKIYFYNIVSACVTVEADDEEDATDKAFDELPSDVCASCSGWSRGDYSLEITGEWHFEESEDLSKAEEE